MKQTGKKITCLTCYDYSFAKIFDNAGIDIILIGDSLGMIIQGSENTLKVSILDMCYHTKIVASGHKNSYLISDMPYLSYENNDDALKNATKLLNSGANMVKLEGANNLDIFKTLNDNNIPVCGHLGLQPQSIKKQDDYKVQGTNKKDADKILKSAIKLQQNGVKLIILECIPEKLAKKITKALTIPTIGIGAGVECDGQVLVCYDMLGIGKKLKFSKNFLEAVGSIKDATKNFINEVKNKTFPEKKHSFQ